ncbi:MAG: hypothetical protein GKR89_15780 [Candidatus Latescibacteria bacterium]|nr:hypothetical protein [Candidatus Latescibacterota bacterium]
MKSFIKVIGASVGVVALVFLVVVGVVSWSGGGEEEQEIANLQQEAVAPPPKETAAVPSLPPAPPAQVERVKYTPPPTLPDPVSPAAVGAAPTPAAKEGKDEKMSAEEYIEREVYYIEKIEKDTKSVLKRAAEDRSKLAALETELDGLLYTD